MAGVPCGTKCSNIWLVFLIHPNNIKLIRSGRAKVNVSVKCLVLVKMHGNSPRKLFVRIIRNNDVKMNEFPFFSIPFILPGRAKDLSAPPRTIYRAVTE